MLNFPIIDTHLHLWDPTKLRYPWLDDIPVLNKSYLLADYDVATGGYPVEKMVFMQCEVDVAQFMDEAMWVAGLAEQEPRIAAIIPWAPLEQGDAARAVLDEYARNPRIKGVRRVIQFEPDIEFCLRPDFVKGVQALADYGMSFDICISHVQLANTIRLVEQCPDVRFMLDHIAKPDIRNHALDPWRDHIKTLAGFENVWCKVSGLVTEADHQQWTPADLKPYIDHVVACFGTERICFGGDWPVVLQAAAWGQWVETLHSALDGVTQAELHRVFRDNAAAFYRLS